MKIIKAKDYGDMCRKAANFVSAQVILHPTSILGLATGATPLGIYAQLAEWYRKGDIDFSGVTTVNLDEYCGVSYDDPHSYRWYMNEHFFNKININKGNTFLPLGNATDLEQECRRYETHIALFGGIDLQLVGLGHNGHVGFNEPGEVFDKTTHVVTLAEETRRNNAKYFDSADSVPTKAITMGLKSIMMARKIVLVVNGTDKKDILDRALFGPVTPEVPASILQMHPNLYVYSSVE